MAGNNAQSEQMKDFTGCDKIISISDILYDSKIIFNSIER